MSRWNRATHDSILANSSLLHCTWSHWRVLYCTPWYTILGSEEAQRRLLSSTHAEVSFYEIANLRVHIPPVAECADGERMSSLAAIDPPQLKRNVSELVISELAISIPSRREVRSRLVDTSCTLSNLAIKTGFQFAKICYNTYTVERPGWLMSLGRLCITLPRYQQQMAHYNAQSLFCHSPHISRNQIQGFHFRRKVERKIDTSISSVCHRSSPVSVFGTTNPLSHFNRKFL